MRLIAARRSRRRSSRDLLERNLLPCAVRLGHGRGDRARGSPGGNPALRAPVLCTDQRDAHPSAAQVRERSACAPHRGERFDSWCGSRAGGSRPRSTAAGGSDVLARRGRRRQSGTASIETTSFPSGSPGRLTRKRRCGAALDAVLSSSIARSSSRGTRPRARDLDDGSTCSPARWDGDGARGASCRPREWTAPRRRRRVPAAMATTRRALPARRVGVGGGNRGRARRRSTSRRGRDVRIVVRARR